MRRKELIRGVPLDAVSEGLTHDVGGDAVEQQVADGVRCKVQAVIAGEIRKLPVNAVDRSLHGQHGVLGILELVFLELRRTEGGAGLAKRACDHRISDGSLSRVVRNLECGGESSGDQAEPRVRVNEGRQVSEALVLVGVVVDREIAACRILQSFIRCQIPSGEKILDAGEAVRAGQCFGSGSRCRHSRTGAAEGTAVLDRRRDRFLTAAVNADLAAIVENIGAGRDVDQPDRPQAIFGRERADHQAETADPAGVKNAAEAGRAVGQHHAIDAELQIGVVVADVEEAAGRRILRDAGELQQDALDRCVVAAGKRVDRSLGQSGRRRADGGEEVAARLIERVGLGVELRRRRDRRRRSRRRRSRRGSHLGAARLGFLLRRSDDDLGKFCLRISRRLRVSGFAEGNQCEQRRAAEQISAAHAIRTNEHDTPP